MSLPGLSLPISSSSGATGGTIGPVENVLNFGSDDNLAMLALVGVGVLALWLYSKK